MSKLLHDTVFFRLTETGSYDFKGGTRLYSMLSQSYLRRITCILPLTTPNPTALAALLKEYKDVFSETMDQNSSLRDPACCTTARVAAQSMSPLLLGVKFDNSSPLETQAQEQDLNPDPGSPRACGPRGCPPVFFGVKPQQAEAPAKPQSQDTSTSSTMMAPEEEYLKFPNGGRDDTYTNFMSLKSSQVTNQEPTQERGTGLRPNPMTTTLEQDNQVAKLRFLTNERTPGLSAILLPLDLSTQFPRPRFPQCPDEPPMENVKFGGGVLYRPKDPALQTYCHF
ncbi:hypothetical protein DSO57_1002205 [Entomophthora muscae]|uniref:Uncharacterized protein n=1 Tax=Entomophthora muscae TaxID=34485 RepID=A0ACC2U6N5_9FUNG|nr:hypothetical protein DSO57_1002205 [Entomophthora muscae]